MADKMKKQFFRVKELANQSLFRGEKTEVLTESLLLAERRIDALQKACSVSARKILSGLAGHGTDVTSVEKRSKKVPEIVLGNAMLEHSVPFGEASVLGRILQDVGQLEVDLGYELLQYEVKVEQIVANHLQQVENEVSNVVKTRRNLNRLTVEMDASRKVFESNRLSTGTTKSDQLREEMEDANQKVEVSRDALASEIYSLISREPEFAEIIVQYARLKRDYHKAALQLLDANIPKLEQAMSDNPCRPAFGTKLEVHLDCSERTIAYPLEVCVCALLEVGLEEEGLFRVAGGSSKVRKVKVAFDAGYGELRSIVDDCRDPHAIASVLKSYLRELPEPLLTHELYDEWVAAVRVPDQECRLTALKKVLERIPQVRYANLRYLVKFLNELVKYQDVNKMTPSNLAIVMAPNLIWSPVEDNNNMIGMNMSLANTHSLIVEHLINHFDFFFPDASNMDFYVTCTKVVREQPSPRATPPNTRSSAPAPITRSHQRMGSFDGLLSFANGGDPGAPPGSPKPHARRKNKPAPVPPTSPKPEPEAYPLPAEGRPQERPPLPPPPSERTATLPRVKEQKAQLEKALAVRGQSKDDLLAEIDREVAKKLEGCEGKTGQEGEEDVARSKENVGLARAASIRNRAALFEKMSEDGRMTKSLGALSSDTAELKAVQKRITIGGQQVLPVRVPVPAERVRIPVMSQVGQGDVNSADKLTTNIEVEKSKPIIPERPSALPRLERKNSTSEFGQERPVLEKTHLYSVDKQQASLFQVQPHDKLIRKDSSSSIQNFETWKGASSPAKEIPGSSNQDGLKSPNRNSFVESLFSGKTFTPMDDDEPSNVIKPDREVIDLKSGSDGLLKSERSGESSDSDPEIRKKPVKPPKPERPISAGRKSLEADGVAIPAVSSGADKTVKDVLASIEGKTPPTPLPRPASHPLPNPKPRSGSGESTDF